MGDKRGDANDLPELLYQNEYPLAINILGFKYVFFFQVYKNNKQTKKWPTHFDTSFACYASAISAVLKY